MSKTKAIILTAFVLAMAAGVALGMLSSRTIPQRNSGHSWLGDELQLTATQEQQMCQIWSGVMQSKGKAFAEQMRSLQQEREAAISTVLTADQKAQLDQINDRFVQRAGDLWKSSEQPFMAAAEKTRSILSDSQRSKYDALLEKFRADGASGNWVFGPGPKGPSTAPSTRPAK